MASARISERKFLLEELSFVWTYPRASSLGDALFCSNPNEERICTIAQSLLQTFPLLRSHIVGLALSNDEIKLMWDRNSRDADTIDVASVPLAKSRE